MTGDQKSSILIPHNPSPLIKPSASSSQSPNGCSSVTSALSRFLPANVMAQGVVVGSSISRMSPAVSTAASSTPNRHGSSIAGGSLFEEESLEVNTRMPYPEMIYVDPGVPSHGRNMFAMMRHLMASENMDTVR
jgi:hypothetical protein